MIKLIIKGLVFLVLLVFLFIANMFIFRSEVPYLWFVSLFFTIVGLLLFPYKTFFKNPEVEQK